MEEYSSSVAGVGATLGDIMKAQMETSEGEDQMETSEGEDQMETSEGEDQMETSEGEDGDGAQDDDK